MKYSSDVFGAIGEVVPLGPLRRGLALHALLLAGRRGSPCRVKRPPASVVNRARRDHTFFFVTDSWHACCAMRASALSCSVYPIFSQPAYLGMSGVVQE